MYLCVCESRYLDPDMYSMMEDSSDTIRSAKFKKLTQAICGLVSKGHLGVRGMWGGEGGIMYDQVVVLCVRAATIP